MPFPTSVQGCVSVDRGGKEDLDAFINAMESVLRRSKAFSVSQEFSKLCFHRKLGREASNARSEPNLMFAIPAGELQFAKNDQRFEIHYRIFFLKDLGIGAALLIFFYGVLPWLLHGPTLASAHHYAGRTAFAFVAGLLLLVVFDVVSLISFRRFLKESATTIVTGVQPVLGKPDWLS